MDLFLYIWQTGTEKNILKIFSFYLRMILFVIYSHSYDLFIVPTSCTYNALSKIPFFRTKRAIILHLDILKIHFKLKGMRKRSEKKIILCVARITPINGQDILINTFKELTKEFKDWTLIFVGKNRR